MIIELKGVEFQNKGAKLMLLACIDVLRREFPEASFALCTSSKTLAADVRAIPAYRKVSFRKGWLDVNALCDYIPKFFRKLFFKLGVVTEADIDMVIDAAGFSYSDQWKAQTRIYHLVNELHRFSKRGKPYVFLPQAFGPFTNTANRERIRKHFHKAALICARDEISLKYIEAITGPMPTLVKFPDFTIDLQPQKFGAYELPRSAACIIPNSNMISFRNPDSRWVRRYPELLIDLIGLYREFGLSPFFLNHSGDEDKKLISHINSSLASPIHVLDQLDALDIKKVIGSSRIVFCSRYHGCVSALSQGLACLATGWSHKYFTLYAEYGVDDLLLTPNVKNHELTETIALCLTQNNSVINRIHKRAADHRRESRLMWEKLFEIVNEYPSFVESGTP